MIIRQKRSKMFSATRVVINFDDTIPGELGSFGTRAGWVLTGGRSSRMGRDKALIELEGRPLALRVADSIAGVCGTVTLVGDPANYGPLGLPGVPDLHPDQGPLAGIEAALSATEADWNLIVACDMPALNPASLEALFGTDADIAVPEHSDGFARAAVRGAYHRRCGAAVQAGARIGYAQGHRVSGGKQGNIRAGAEAGTVRKPEHAGGP